MSRLSMRMHARGNNDAVDDQLRNVNADDGQDTLQQRDDSADDSVARGSLPHEPECPRHHAEREPGVPLVRNHARPH